MSTLDEENRQVLNLVQALLGAVSPNFRAASILYGETIVLNFWLEEDLPLDREEIEGIEFKFMAHQSSFACSVTTQVVITSQPFVQIQAPGRLVFLRREPIDSASDRAPESASRAE